jgi:hypothetical protein
MPYYLNRLGELNIEDNNEVLNYQLSGNTSNKGIGGGLTIQDGDDLGNDVTFRISYNINIIRSHMVTFIFFFSVIFLFISMYSMSIDSKTEL